MLPRLMQTILASYPAAGPDILLFCRSGFEHALREEAAADGKMTLVDTDRLVAALDSQTDH